MDKPSFVYTSYIRSTPKKVWAAITEPKFTRQYWAGASNVSDWKKGSKWEHVFAEEKDPVAITGQVLESSPPKRLVLSWIDPDNTKDKSRVTIEIQPDGEMVCLVVTHDSFKADTDMVRKVSYGWPRVLCSLKSFLETGEGLEIFCHD